MPYNGVGVFERLYQWVNDEANGLFVDADRTDADSNDIADGLTNCMTRDGQSAATANIPLGGYKITGLAAGAAATDAVNFGQVFTAPTFAGLTATGAVNFAGATTVTVPTVAAGDNSTKAASTAFATQLAFQSALPAQSLGLLISDGAATPTASFSKTLTGFALNEVKGADIASAATINLTTATGNLVHVTGTTTITAITIPIGAERTVIFDGILTLTHGAALLIPGAANITTAANDRMTARGDTAGAIVTSYTKADGTAVIVTPPGSKYLGSLTTSGGSAVLNGLTLFTSTYDSYMLIGRGLTHTTVGTDQLKARFAVAGALDTTAVYGEASYNATMGTAALTSFIIGTNVYGASVKGISFVMHVTAANSSGFKTVSQSGAFSSSATDYQAFGQSAIYRGSSAITGIGFFWLTGYIFPAGGVVDVYGIAKV